MISNNKVKMSEISYNEVNEFLAYNEKTGVFRWKVGRGSKKAGSIAGCLNPTTGYWCVRIRRKGYSAHRMAWLLYYGYLPESSIDHIDKNKLNNSISNLREASQSCNCKNASTRSDNTSGVKGVNWHSGNKIWIARIAVNGKDYYIKGSKDFDEAVAHRLAAEQCLGDYWCDSNSDASRYIESMLKLC